MGFKRTARVWKKTVDDMVNMPFEFVKQQRSRKENGLSYVSQLLDQKSAELNPDYESVIKFSAASLYSAGSDTVSSSEAGGPPLDAEFGYRRWVP